MAGKTRRIELRAEEATLNRIQQAANVVHEQTSEFVRKAAMQRAEDILRQELVTVMELHIELVARRLYGALFGQPISEGTKGSVQKDLPKGIRAFRALAR